MAVFARSGEQERASRRGVWMLAVAPFAAIALAVGAGFAVNAVYAERALPGKNTSIIPPPTSTASSKGPRQLLTS